MQKSIGTVLRKDVTGWVRAECGTAEARPFFTCKIKEQNCQLALVQPFKKHVRAATKEDDKALSIHRWQAQSRERCQVIPLDCIIRGAVLVKDPTHAADYFVIDMLDSDMYLRVKNTAS